MLGRTRRSRVARVAAIATSILILILGTASFASAGYGDGSGAMTAGTTSAAAGDTNQTFTFTYEAAVDFTGAGSGGSSIRLTIPSAWGTPQRTNSGAANYVSVAEVTPNNCNPGTIAISAVTGGNRLSIPMGCHDGDQLRITFAHVGVPTVAGSSTFTAWSEFGNSQGADLTAGSPTITVTPLAANKLAFTTQPPASSAAGASFGAVVTVQDTYGNTVTGSTASITVASSGGTLNGTKTVNAINGVATFSGLSINQAGGPWTLSATSGSLAGATSSQFSITAGAANKLAFTTQPPASSAAGASFGAVVTVQDTYGNTVTGSTASITVASSGGTLNGTKTVNAINGVATFSGLSINQAGGPWTLSATSGSLAGATSSQFSITADAATQLVVTTQPPATTTAGSTFTVVVTARDQYGNTATGFGSNVSLGFGANPGAGTLSGTTTRTPVNGVATFTGISVNKAGVGYTLIASATGLNVTTSAFTVTAAAASQLAFGQQPSNAIVGATIAPAVTVQILDQYGNLTSSTANVSIAIQTGTGTLSGTTTRAAVGGVATFNNLSINAAGNFTLRATSTGLTRVDSNSFAITLQPISVTFYTRLCSAYTDVPANWEPTVNYGGGWNGNDTGGHNSQLNTSYQTALANAATDLVCDPYTGTWSWSMWDSQDSVHHTGGNPTLVGTATTTGATGSTTITLNPAELALARGSGLWVTVNVNQSVAGFGAIRCYDDIHYSDNSETVIVPNGTTDITCIAYNVKPKITFNSITPTPKFGDPAITLSSTTTATGTGPTITYSASGACSVAGDVLTINAAGPCSVTAHEAQVPGTSNFWAAADDVTQTFTVGKATPTCEATGYNVTYNAGPHTAVGECRGVGNVVLTGLDLSGTTHTAANTYNDTWQFTDTTGNYENASGPVVDIIGLRPMSITLGDGTKTYGTTFSGLIVLIQSGLQSGDSVDCDRTSAGFAADAIVGHYAITCTNIHGDNLSNYDITVTPGDLNVTPAALDITADNQAKAYGDSAFDLGTTAFTPVGLVNGDTVTGVTLSSPGEAVTADLGTYDITPAGAVGSGLGNYTIAYHPGTLTVGQARLTITASSATVSYGSSTLPTITPIITGYVNGDDDSVLSVPPSCIAPPLAGMPVGFSMPSMCSGAASEKYLIDYLPGSVTVGPATLTVTASSGSFIVGGTPPTITAQITGWVMGQDASVLTAQPTCSTTATSASPVGTYPSSCTGAAAANYTFDYVPGTVAVDPVPVWQISLAKSADRTTFNAAGQTIGYTYTIVNTGNQPVGPAQFSVSDNKIDAGAAFACGPATTTLTPNTGTMGAPSAGSFVTCHASYTVTQADVDAGFVRNVASASVGGEVKLVSETAEVTVEAAQGASLELVKTPNQTTFTNVGDSITYTYTLTNNGNVTLTGPFAVTDDKIASVDCSAAAGQLAPGQHTACTASYAITQADIDAGTVVNHATGYGHYIESNVASNGAMAQVRWQAPGATPTPTPTEQVGGVTAAPQQPTLPTTNTTPSQSDSGSTPLLALLLCLAFGGLGLLVVQAQRRSIRN